MCLFYFSIPATANLGPIDVKYLFIWGFPRWLSVKNLPVRAGDVGQEDPLEKEMANHSGILAWEIPWTEEPGGYSPWGRRVRHDCVTEQAHTSTRNLAHERS